MKKATKIIMSAILALAVVLTSGVINENLLTVEAAEATATTPNRTYTYKGVEYSTYIGYMMAVEKEKGCKEYPVSQYNRGNLFGKGNLYGNMETIYDMTTILAKYTSILAHEESENTYYWPSVGYLSDGTAEIIYDKIGYDALDYNVNGYDIDGYNAAGYNIGGYKKDGYNDAGYDKYGYDRNGYDRLGYNKYGYDKNGYDRAGYDKDGYDKSGYNKSGYDKSGHDRTSYDKNDHEQNSYDQNSYEQNIYNANDYDKNSYKKKLPASYSVKEEQKKETLVKINKTNFQGLYKLLKEKYYDDNQDGYLSASECKVITYLQIIKKVSSLEGIRYFPNLNSLSLQEYTGTKITITKENKKLKTLNVSSQKTKLIIDAPFIKQLNVERMDLSDINGPEDLKINSKFKTLDISNCKNLKHLYVVQKLSTLIMPKKDNELQFVECQNLKVKSLNLKNCVKLGYLCITDSYNLKSLKLSNNTNLEGIVLIRNKKFISVDASKSKKLSAVYVYGNQNDSILKKNIKLPKGKNVKFPRNLIPLFKIEKKYRKWQY